MILQCYGYTLRSTRREDFPLLDNWTASPFDTEFWLMQETNRQSFLVSLDEPIGVFQTQYVKRDQIRIHFQASPVCSPKKILRAITRLIPLIEEALRLRGVTAIFFTSHSPRMVTFMEKLGYQTKKEWGTLDGQVMAKRFKQ